MRRLAIVFSLALFATPVHAAGPTFSIDFQGPSVFFGAPDGFGVAPVIDEGSILTSSIFVGPVLPPGPNIPWGAGAPAGGPPGMMVDALIGSPLGSVPGGLGLVPPYEIDALSYGRDVIGAATDLWFSVDEFACGDIFLPFGGLDVLDEGPCGTLVPLPGPEASADVFIFPGPIVPTLPVLPGTGFNFGFLDGDGIPTFVPLQSLGLIEPNPPGPGVPDMGDNLDALDMDTLLSDLTAPFPGTIFFSLDSAFPDFLEGVVPPNTGSAVAQGLGFVGGDVLVSFAGAPAPLVAIPAAALGLDFFGPDTDDLDALAFDDADGSATLTFGDTVFFSVRRGSAVIGAPDSCTGVVGVPIEEGDILTVPGIFSPFPCLFIAAEAMGLGTGRSGTFGIAHDDVDAIDLPEPGVVPQLVAGACLLFGLARRRRGRG